MNATKRHHAPLLAATLGLLLPLAAQAQTDLRIQIPAQSSMQLYAPDAYTSLVSFTGPQVLQGHLLARAEQHVLDDQAQWHISLLFIPSRQAEALLPRVRVPGEADVGIHAITLEHFDRAAMTRWIDAVFGPAISARIGTSAFVVATEGTATLGDYRTGIECDTRHHYARLDDFIADHRLDQPQAQSLAHALPSGCAP